MTITLPPVTEADNRAAAAGLDRDTLATVLNSGQCVAAGVEWIPVSLVDDAEFKALRDRWSNFQMCMHQADLDFGTGANGG